MDKQSLESDPVPSQKPAPDLPPETGDPETDHEARVEYWKATNQPPVPKPKHTGRWVTIIALILLVLVAAGGFAYWKFFMQQPAVVTVTDNSKKKVVDQKTITAATKHYASTTLNLEFDYPADWTVINDTANSPLTVRSPAMQLKDATNKTATGQIVMTVEAKQTSISAFDKGNATAVRESEKVSYTKPTSAQRAQTYLSFLQYASTTGTGLNGIYVTGDHGYTKDQYIPKTDITSADPLVRVVFVKCSDTACADATPEFAIAANSWDSKTFADPIRNMLTSLAIN
ncbi:MAG TPA: hypothetical protein VH144_03070 [Candidatus Saccharimonadales bacterium]|jgi:cytoskeletal protein RodZ|nr:hypothetical protein [Candidatus Saccharimonadales bacterium]